MLHDQGVGQGANVQAFVPVRLGAREAGGLQGEPGADLSQADSGHQPVEVVAALGGGAALAQVLVQDQDLAAIPAELHGPLGQRILPFRALAMEVDLAGRRLAEVDIGLALQMVGGGASGSS